MVASDGKPDAPPIFVMSFPNWKGQFGADPGIIGKSFAIEGATATLVGVMPERFHGFGRDAGNLDASRRGTSCVED